MNRWFAGLMLALTMVTMTGCGAGRFSEGTLLSDRDLVGYRVDDKVGGSIGEVASVVVDLSNGELEYIAVELSRHPRAQVAHVLILVPWSELTLDREARALIADASNEALQAAPWFEALPDTREANWDEALRAYWSRQ